MSVRPLRLPLLIGLGTASIACSLPIRPAPYRFDTRDVPRPLSRDYHGREARVGGLDPETMRQLSGGCVTGFVSGLIVSTFSRMLVLLLGLSVILVQVVSQYGIDLVQQLRLKQRVRNSRILAALEEEPAFKLSFGIFFAMSAFMRFE
ncbi:hypothetical protein GGS23DRAFT_601314 [Durotheca rogersii]|uniref:uncharacterized protein n=1 Tax=Durotheca rogersii TaxID=419775 RepID=UPI00221F5B2B|nr:uncharacterized protein GGS23DRAFT_601314 [Durotheca rogersii]KAI5855603.1 hypothetical protein GGS23DRAFT_601314 [Durotheca rogersii]